MRRYTLAMIGCLVSAQLSAIHDSCVEANSHDAYGHDDLYYFSQNHADLGSGGSGSDSGSQTQFLSSPSSISRRLTAVYNVSSMCHRGLKGTKFKAGAN